RADAREDAIEDAELRRGGGHKASGLIEEHDQCDLPQIGRLAAHVRAGDDLNAVAIADDVGVIGDESLACDGLDYRMAPVLDDDFRVLAQRWSNVAIANGDRCERCERVELSDG